jgi:hypothetical protein
VRTCVVWDDGYGGPDGLGKSLKRWVMRTFSLRRLMGFGCGLGYDMIALCTLAENLACLVEIDQWLRPNDLGFTLSPASRM